VIGGGTSRVSRRPTARDSPEISLASVPEDQPRPSQPAGSLRQTSEARCSGHIHRQRDGGFRTMPATVAAARARDESGCGGEYASGADLPDAG
jgi:hypothetical protein